MSTDKANKMSAEAEALATKTFPPWGLKEKKEEAIEIWKKAAAIYKVNKEWRAAAKAYKRAAEVANIIKNEMESTNNFGEAGKALKNLEDGEKESIPLFTACAEGHIKNNRMSTGAKVYRQIAEIEEKLGRVKEAIDAYNMAAEIFYTCDMGSDGHACMVKVAEFDAQAANYKKAVESYEKVIEASLPNKLLVFGVKGYMFHALLCKFGEAIKSKHANVAAAVQEALDRYNDQHPAMDGSREAKFIAQMIKAYAEGKYEDLVNAINTQNRIYKLTPLQTALCEVIKKNCPGQTIVVGKGGATSGGAGGGAARDALLDDDDGPPDMQGRNDKVDLQSGAGGRVGGAAAAAGAGAGAKVNTPKQTPAAAAGAGAGARADAKTAPQQQPSAANAAAGASASAAYAAAVSNSASPAPVSAAVSPAPVAAAAAVPTPAPVAAAAPAPAPVASAAPAAAPGAGDEPNMM